MDTITLVLVIFIASLIIILISVLVIWIIHDLNRIKNIKRVHHHHHHHQRQRLLRHRHHPYQSSPLTTVENTNDSYKTSSMYKPIIFKQNRRHRINHLNTMSNSFISYVSKSCDNQDDEHDLNQKSEQQDQMKMEPLMMPAINHGHNHPYAQQESRFIQKFARQQIDEEKIRNQRKLRTFLLTLNNTKFDGMIDDTGTYECDSFCDECLLMNRSTMVSSRPIPVERFLQAYQSKVKDSDLGYSREFCILENVCKQKLYARIEVEDKRPANKDRFQNVVPYKHSIVRLDEDIFATEIQKEPRQEEDDPKEADDINISSDSTYINASFIPGYHSNREYIATLAPWNLDTMDDFFRMILQYRITTVVNLVEFECISYFPKWTNDDPIRRQICGRWLRIKLIEKFVEEDFQIKRVHFLSDETDRIVHEVWQFHFTNWKDFSCPEQEEMLLKFMQKVRQFHHNNSQSSRAEPPPLLVHCRAGIGRTGTYIAIDQLWQKLNHEFLLPELPRRNVWKGLFEYYESKYLLEQKIKRKYNNVDNNLDIKSSTVACRSPQQLSSSKSASKLSDRIFERRKFQTISGLFRGQRKFQLDHQHQPMQTPKKYSIDIYALIYSIRSHRIGMVQTESQYAYIHKCVKHILERWKCFDLENENDYDRINDDGCLQAVISDSGSNNLDIQHDGSKGGHCNDLPPNLNDRHQHLRPLSTIVEEQTQNT